VQSVSTTTKLRQKFYAQVNVGVFNSRTRKRLSRGPNYG